MTLFTSGRAPPFEVLSHLFRHISYSESRERCNNKKGNLLFIRHTCAIKPTGEHYRLYSFNSINITTTIEAKGGYYYQPV